jgi:hypothetical protein
LALTDGRDIISTWMSEAEKPKKRPKSQYYNKERKDSAALCISIIIISKETFQSIINGNVQE